MACKELRSVYCVLITSKKLNKRKKKISNFSSIHQRTEVTGQTAAPKIGETGGYRELHLSRAKPHE